MTIHTINRFYGKTARFDDNRAVLTEDQIRAVAPSIFAVDKHASRSDRFQPIPTIDIVRGLANEGFQVVGAMQSRSRDAGKREFTKHLLRLRRVDETHRVGDVLPEMILKNANDGTAAYELSAALYRIQCMNSLVAAVADLESTKVRHSGSAEKVMGNVIDGTYRVIDAARNALGAPEEWGRLQLTHDDRRALATAAHAIRFENAIKEDRQTIEPVQLLDARRVGDRPTDLWTTFNIVQENAIRGGQQFRRAQRNEAGELTGYQNARTREVCGVDQRTGINKALWILADYFAQQKGVKIAA